MLGAPTREDMLDIVNAWHPSLQPILARLIGRSLFMLITVSITVHSCMLVKGSIFCTDTFERVNYIASCHMGVQAGGSASGGTLSRFSLRYVVAKILCD